MTKYCFNCGGEQVDDDIICSKCGLRKSKETKSNGQVYTRGLQTVLEKHQSMPVKTGGLDC